MSEIQKLIQDRLAQKAGNREPEQIRFSVSLDSEINVKLEHLAQILDLSKSACAAELITRSIQEAEQVLSTKVSHLETPPSPVAQVPSPPQPKPPTPVPTIPNPKTDQRSIVPISKIKRKKEPKTNIQVTFADGTIIENSQAAPTFAEVIGKMGVEKVKALGIPCCGDELVSLDKHDKYKQYQIGKYYVFTHTSTKVKIKKLLEISNTLKIGIKIVEFRKDKRLGAIITRKTYTNSYYPNVSPHKSSNVS
jgi:hypothetical protein